MGHGAGQVGDTAQGRDSFPNGQLCHGDEKPVEGLEQDSGASDRHLNHGAQTLPGNL